MPEVEAAWLAAFETAEYVWLSDLRHRRVPWTPATRSYFLTHFEPVPDRGAPAGLHRRR
ncbi:hypothetical protein [Saccharopolyspora sp. 5N708]|uniref:hypothetical protein n=1 Tax=Saccharopolyspora sp. 5N708 TaxID=3457424 RepID=UPI003FD084AC